MPLNEEATWSHLEDEWLRQPSPFSNFDWRVGLQRIEDAATLQWFSATWGKESERHRLMKTPRLPPPLAHSPTLRNLRTISTPPFLDHSEPPVDNLLVFADYDDLWRDISLWITERRTRFIPNDQTDEEVAFKFDHPPPTRQEPEYLPQLCLRKVLLCLGAAGIGTSNVHNWLASSSRRKTFRQVDVAPLHPRPAHVPRAAYRLLRARRLMVHLLRWCFQASEKPRLLGRTVQQRD